MGRRALSKVHNFDSSLKFAKPTNEHQESLLNFRKVLTNLGELSKESKDNGPESLKRCDYRWGRKLSSMKKFTIF